MCIAFMWQLKKIQVYSARLELEIVAHKPSTAVLKRTQFLDRHVTH